MGRIRRTMPAFSEVPEAGGAPTLSAELARYVAEVAGEAPSVHNTQPWTFGWGPTYFDVFADRGRQLKRIDADGRLLTISCGAAAYNAQLAMRALGWAVDVALLPNRDPNHLARLTVKALDATAPTAGEWSLLQAIGERGSYRGNFTSRLGTPLLEELGAAVRAGGCQLYRIERSGQRDEVARLIRSSNAVLEADAGYYEELARWRRPDDGAPDGIPRSALGLGRPAAAGTTFPPRDFALDDRLEGAFAALEAKPVHATALSRVVEPDVLAIWTLRDGPQEWINAGRALSALLLTATCAGAAAGLLDQPLEDASTRRLLTAALGVNGPVQILLRIGLPDGGPGTTPRRAVTETLK